MPDRRAKSVTKSGARSKHSKQPLIEFNNPEYYRLKGFLFTGPAFNQSITQLFQRPAPFHEPHMGRSRRVKEAVLVFLRVIHFFADLVYASLELYATIELFKVVGEALHWPVEVCAKLGDYLIVSRNRYRTVKDEDPSFGTDYEDKISEQILVLVDGFIDIRERSGKPTVPLGPRETVSQRLKPLRQQLASFIKETPEALLFEPPQPVCLPSRHKARARSRSPAATSSGRPYDMTQQNRRFRSRSPLKRSSGLSYRDPSTPCPSYPDHGVLGYSSSRSGFQAPSSPSTVSTNSLDSFIREPRAQTVDGDDSAGSGEDSAGSDESSAGSDEDSAGSDENSAGSGEDSEGSDEDSVCSDEDNEPPQKADISRPELDGYIFALSTAINVVIEAESAGSGGLNYLQGSIRDPILILELLKECLEKKRNALDDAPAKKG